MNYKPLPGSLLFNALKDQNSIIMACNPRITKSIIPGIFRAAKETDSAIIFELAKSECDLKGGYTGITPKMLADCVKKEAKTIGFDVYSIHADHIGVKKGTPEEIADIKKLIDAQVKAGYTSFAIDASHLFVEAGKNEEGQLSENIRCTIELANYIKEKMKGKEFGLEVEVGEIGKKDEHGKVITTPQEAVTFIKKLNENSIYPQVLAIANGSSHGNTYVNGKLVEQVSIDIPKTTEIVNSLKKNNFHVRIAQHGITGTPLHLIKEHFPKGDILKGNVATHWQNIFFDALKEELPELYNEMLQWTLTKYGESGKSDEEIFGKHGKNAIGQFYKEIYAISDDVSSIIENKVIEDAKKFFDAFNSYGTAKIVRGFLK